ncbi:competence protein CoiA [Bradyrhizobium diazoefficiens]|uniref:competence protein CoiA n=1 Tax=Bradyrhizobium diazoefficiens TaxID=1355477 RepID=UPI000D727C94|nr:competence protein CoiA family protein [Bradyrhizobium diazoefficiens]AWO92430.1 competence protein [Bradyrhizobium diazoefficiens]
MKLAFVAGERVGAFAGARGECPSCRGEVIAKCGSHRVWHWAHFGIRDCDTWAEPETEWHRAWKNNFPADFQEFIQHDAETGERHIADVRTSHGLVLEFQHSHLNPQERVARERFYGNMLWVVDCTRLKGDYPRLLKGKDGLRPIINGHFLLAFPEECFPKMWLDCSVPVIFDFRGLERGASSDPYKNTLWCLLPGRAEGNAVVVGLSPEQFVSVTPTRAELISKDTVANFAQVIRERAEQNARLSYQPLGGFTGGPLRRTPRF